MARPLRIEYPGAFYHATSRGNEKKDIFKSQRDREQFLSYLESATKRYGAVIHVYCLMNNHYHLLLETPLGNLSQIMRHINGAYTTYFNVKRKRAGHLFQGRYKAILVDADAYAKELSRYIHLNPVRAGIVARPEEYPWSSYQCFIGKKETPAWLKTDFIIGYFGERAGDARKRYGKFVDGLIGKEYMSPLSEAVVSTILGGSEFVKEIIERHLQEKQPDRNMPALKALSGKPSFEAILQAVKIEVGEDEDLSKKASIYLCHRYSGARLKEIGDRFGLSDSAVSQASRRFAVKLKDDKKLKKMVEKVMAGLVLSGVET